MFIILDLPKMRIKGSKECCVVLPDSKGCMVTIFTHGTQMGSSKNLVQAVAQKL